MEPRKHTPQTPATEGSGTDRRKLLGAAWAAGLAALFGQGMASLFRFLKPLNTGGFGGFVRAGRVDEFQPGSVSRIQQGRFFLTRLEDGAFLAQWQRCTHLGCSVPWSEDEGQFHCPCHGSIFSRTGEVLGGPAPRPMDLFPVIIEDGEVFVDTGRPEKRSRFDPNQTTRT